jgi:rubrerythrin
MSLMLLTHAAEELRHAKALKGLAERLGGTRNTGYSAEETLCGADARAYFQTLDDRVAEQVGAQSMRLAYLYETLLIEERALAVYPKLMEAFRSPWVLAVGRGILAEEDRHLEEIQRELARGDTDHRERLAELRASEESLFAAFAEALVAETLAAGATRIARGSGAEAGATRDAGRQ